MQPNPEPRSPAQLGLPAGTSVSATFMSFMQPVLDGLGNDRNAWRAIASVASSVWNSEVLDVRGTTHVDDIRNLLAGRDFAPLLTALTPWTQHTLNLHCRHARRGAALPPVSSKRVLRNVS